MSTTKDKILLCAGIATGAVMAQVLYNYYKSKPDQPNITIEEKGFTDANYEEQKNLYKTEAFIRSEIISEVNYKIALALLKGGESFHGQVEVTFTMRHNS